MQWKNFEHRIPTAILGFFTRRLPGEERPWAEAMLSEVEAIAGDREKLVWALSGSWGLSRIWFRTVFLGLRMEERRPAALVLIAVYHAVFSCVVLTVLIRQLPLIKAPFSEALCPLLLAFFVALLPAAIAVGIWLLDEAARWWAIVFSLVHGLGNYAWMSSLNLGWQPLPTARIVLDVVMICVLLLPSTRRAFRPPQIELGLGNF
jgi:hypothetical protein